MDDISSDWLKVVEEALLKNQQLPILEEHFPFPWEAAGVALQKSLELPQLTLSCLRTSWKEPDSFLHGMGKFPSIIAFELPPIEGTFFFILSQEDIAKLTSATLTKDEEGFSNPKLRQGFYHFLLLKVLQTIDELSILKDASLHLLGEAALPEESGFCIDVTCALSTHTLQGRVLCPRTFLDAFKTYIPFQKITLLETEKGLTLQCQVGHTSLNPEEWESLQVGDFLVLDQCSFDPTEEKGSLTICLEETPLFVARLKTEGLKVLDFAFYQESPPEDEAPLEEESEETHASETLQLTAIAGTLQIPLSHLIQLKSGSMLGLPIRPEQGVDISLKGKRVARAELLKLGQVSGLRILMKTHG